MSGLSNTPEKYEAIGIKNIYSTVENIDYNQLIKGTKKNIDIIHIHGMTWTNNNRESLKKKLKCPGVSIRVILLDIHGLFFNPYSEFIGKNSEYLIKKTEEVLDIWDTMYREATSNRTKNGANLIMYFHNGFPSKSLYRFDDTIIASPTVMMEDKSPNSPTIHCQKMSNSDCAFEEYMQEIEWLIAHSAKTLDLSKTSLSEYLKNDSISK